LSGISILVLIVVVLGVVALSYFAWISLQSLLQARLLFRLGALSSRIPSADGPVALFGTLRVLDPLRLQGMAGFLWYRRTLQIRRGRGKNARWETAEDNVWMAACLVTSQGREFRVEETPTEVQGTETFTEYLDGGYFFSSNGDRRVRHSRLAIPDRLTVAGRLERRPHGEVVVKDNKVGLLVSPRQPSRAASVELAKGLGGLVAVTAGVAAGLWYYFTLRGPS
jgi:hypothetical protein